MKQSFVNKPWKVAIDDDLYLNSSLCYDLYPLVHVFFSLSPLLKLARSPLPSQKHTCHKVSPSQHRFTKPDLSYSSLDILMPFLLCYSFPHVSSHTCFLFVFPALELPRRIVPPLTAGTRLSISCTFNHSFISITVGNFWKLEHVKKWRFRSAFNWPIDVGNFCKLEHNDNWRFCSAIKWLINVGNSCNLDNGSKEAFEV